MLFLAIPKTVLLQFEDNKPWKKLTMWSFFLTSDLEKEKNEPRYEEKITSMFHISAMVWAG